MKILLLAMVGTSLLAAGCGVLPASNIELQDVAGAPSEVLAADDDGLVVPRHSQCNYGPMILRYLETGDNQGHPVLDQNLGAYVHEPLPQARAMADTGVENCDNAVDRQEQAAQQQVAQVEQQREQQAEQARERQAVQTEELTECNIVGGQLANQVCYSAVKGNPSGRPGDECDPGGHPISLGFNQRGEFLSGFLETSKTFYPGCWK